MSALSSETYLRTPALTSAGRGFYSFRPVPVHQCPCPTGHRARGGAQGGGECWALTGVLPARRMERFLLPASRLHPATMPSNVTGEESSLGSASRFCLDGAQSVQRLTLWDWLEGHRVPGEQPAAGAAFSSRPAPPRETSSSLLP